MSKFKVGDRVSFLTGTTVEMTGTVKFINGDSMWCLWDDKRKTPAYVLKHFLTRITEKEKQMINTDTKVWIIGSYRTDGSISFRNTPYQHPSQTSAKDEAARLARDNPGKKFVVFARDSAVIVGGTMWS